MIKIRVGEVEETFETNDTAMQYVADMAGDKSLKFQRIEYEDGVVSQMDFLTYHQGRFRETYSTRK